jgi:hypothetical protein
MQRHPPSRVDRARRAGAPSRTLVAAAALVAACSPAARAPAPAPPLVTPSDLRAPESFGSVADPVERSRALFLEATRVLLHPRCRNCHPAGDSPFQGDESALHDPPIVRGPADDGVPALRCESCHQDRNLELARVPGAPKWHLAPRTMAWEGRSPAEICAQVKDPARNGGRTLAQILDHAAHDPLVAWGWAPGHGRTPAPGTQARFGALVQAWVESGAACPPDGASARSAARSTRGTSTESAAAR